MAQTVVQLNDHQQRAHSSRGGSNAHRWIACPGSVALVAQTPVTDKTSYYAAEGTAAHQLLDWCLTEQREPEEYPHDTITVDDWVIAVDDEMVGAVQLAVDTVRELIEPGDDVQIEKRFHLRSIHPDLFGTADITIYKPKTKTLVVCDYKHGKGHAVEATGNKQGRYYLIGAAGEEKRPILRAEIYIIQPRCPHPAGPVRSETLDVGDIVGARMEIAEAFAATDAPDAPRVAGDHCKFCPAEAVCPERRAQSLAVAQTEFSVDAEPPALPDPEHMAPEQRAKVLMLADQVQSWIKAVQKFEHDRALAGDTLPGFKLVRGRGSREFTDEEAVRRLVLMATDLDEAELVTTKFKSPKQLEDTLGAKRKNLIAKYVRNNPGKLNLVPESDRRPAEHVAGTDEFTALPSTQE